MYPSESINNLPTLQWASYQIRKLAGCACAGNAGNVFPRRRFQRKLLVSDPGMHHGTCVTHVPWCMSGSLTCGDGENVPGIPGACAPAILRIWQEAHDNTTSANYLTMWWGVWGSTHLLVIQDSKKYIRCDTFCYSSHQNAIKLTSETCRHE